MADVYAIFGTLLALGISFPGLLTAWHLIFPKKVLLAQHRLLHTPWRAFWMGLGVTLFIAIPTSVLLALPVGLAKLLGGLLILASLAVASLGAAGLASGMASRLHPDNPDTTATIGKFIKAAIALELAAAFPFIGWFLVIPLTIICSLGAASFAFLGWGAKTVPEPSLETKVIINPAYPADTAAS
jgi:hypothetical protein